MFKSKKGVKYNGKLNLISSIFLIFSVIILSLVVQSHGDEVNEDKSLDTYEDLKSSSVTYIYIVSFIIIILVFYSSIFKDKNEKIKWILFLGIAIPVILVTFYLAGSTIYLNIVSETKGPVHWHADYEIWNCNQKINLKDARGLSNKVGSPVFHEHDDNRVHVEGVVLKKQHADLHSFLGIVGGELTKNSISIPTNDGDLKISNGDLCNGNQGFLQVFLYKIKNSENTDNWIYEQTKLSDFEDYILSPYSQVPPGDCFIIEFGEEKEKTDHICETYKVAIQKGELSGS